MLEEDNGRNLGMLNQISIFLIELMELMERKPNFNFSYYRSFRYDKKVYTIIRSTTARMKSKNGCP